MNDLLEIIVIIYVTGIMTYGMMMPMIHGFDFGLAKFFARIICWPYIAARAIIREVKKL